MLVIDFHQRFKEIIYTRVCREYSGGQVQVSKKIQA